MPTDSRPVTPALVLNVREADRGRYFRLAPCWVCSSICVVLIALLPLDVAALVFCGGRSIESVLALPAVVYFASVALQTLVTGRTPFIHSFTLRVPGVHITAVFNPMEGDET